MIRLSRCLMMFAMNPQTFSTTHRETFESTRAASAKNIKKKRSTGVTMTSPPATATTYCSCHYHSPGTRRGHPMTEPPHPESTTIDSHLWFWRWPSWPYSIPILLRLLRLLATTPTLTPTPAPTHYYCYYYCYHHRRRKDVAHKIHNGNGFFRQLTK